MPKTGVKEQTALLRANIDQIAAAFVADEPAAAATRRPCFVLLMGLPAPGKSHVAGLLAPRIDATVVATDTLRRRLFIAPSYSLDESSAVFALAHELARRLLTAGRVVIFDATNLRERDRAPLYAIARAASVPLLILRVIASEAAIRERLGVRAARVSASDASEADWSVYQMMRDRYEEPSREYVTLDTGTDLELEVARAEEAIRLACR